MPNQPIVLDPEQQLDNETKTLPPWNVILVNDDHHSVQYVVDVLCKVCGMTPEQAVKTAIKVHEDGRAIVWNGHKELAELKVDQIRTFGADTLAIAAGVPCEGAMTAEMEPAW